VETVAGRPVVSEGAVIVGGAGQNWVVCGEAGRMLTVDTTQGICRCRKVGWRGRATTAAGRAHWREMHPDESTHKNPSLQQPNSTPQTSK